MESLALNGHITYFLILLKTPCKSICWVSMEEPLIVNHSKSIMMTCDHYVNALEQKMAFKEATTKKEQKKDLMIMFDNYQKY